MAPNVGSKSMYFLSGLNNISLERNRQIRKG